MTYEEKKSILSTYLLSKKKLSLALSGGLDSTVLTAYAKYILGEENCLILTAHTPFMMKEELLNAQTIAKELGVRHLILEESTIPEAIANNPPLRCYFCKRILFEKFIDRSRQEGFPFLADGTNINDLSDYRPGHKALKELGIISPFKEAQFTKDDIRQLGQELGLSSEIIQKPAYACLLTRLEHDVPIDSTLLRRIDQAESFLRSLGYKACRVRVENNNARIEVPRENLSRLFSQHHVLISETLSELGFSKITVDLNGYKQGSMNKIIS